MRLSAWTLALGGLVFVSGRVAADEKDDAAKKAAADEKARSEAGGKVAWTAAKGEKATFRVKETSSMKGRTQQGEMEQGTERDIVYAIQVEERKENGDLVLNVTFPTVKIKQEGGRGSLDFDSAKKDAPAEGPAAYLREAAAKTITVKVEGGRITDVAGFPEQARGEDGDRPRGRGGFGGGGTALSRGAVERDLGYILSLPAAGKDLEKGKAYRLERDAARERRPEGDGERRRTRFGGLRGGSPTVYTFVGKETSKGDGAAYVFELAPDSADRPQAGGDAPRFSMDRKGKGTALVSATNGFILQLELDVEETTKGGENFQSDRKSKLSISREGGEKKGGIKL
ncbi:MAG TPA: hypothetical protein VMT52_18100 [Planctomycetota bacterium]|nr:hypothetical protein [Planctomycetota bacterium]